MSRDLDGRNYHRAREVAGIMADMTARGMANRGHTSMSLVKEPFIIAHRGGANLYPEDTMDAYRAIASLGVRVIEIGDTQLLSDGALGIMHDSTVSRTTTSTGNVSDFDAYTWRNLVVSASQCGLGPGAYNSYPPLLDECLRAFGPSVIYVPESKDQKCAAQIAQLLTQYGLKDNAIIQSFSDTDLQTAVPYGIRTMLLQDNYDPPTAKAKGFTYIGVSTVVTQSYIQSCVAAGIKPVVYFLDKRTDWAKWQSWGCVACFSNDPLYLSGTNTHVRTKDPFARQTWYHGQLPTISTDKGGFISPNQWGWSTSNGGGESMVLQGWASPMAKTSGYTINGSITFNAITADTTRWVGVAITVDDSFSDQGSTSEGYHILFRVNGTIILYRIDNGVATVLNNLSTGAAISQGQTITFAINMTASGFSATRTDLGSNNVVSATDATYRGQYLFFSRETIGPSFSNVSIN